MVAVTVWYTIVVRTYSSRTSRNARVTWCNGMVYHSGLYILYGLIPWGTQ
jgi:hypothetical protein